MIVLCLIFSCAAIALHIFIFYLESLAWEGELARKTFKTPSVQAARDSKFFAFNQGFYNLFLAGIALAGVLLLLAGNRDTGSALMLAGLGSMLGAALVLFIASPPHRPAAIKQGSTPLLALLFLALA